LTVGKKRAGKGGCLLHWHDLQPWSAGVIAILLPHEADTENLSSLADLKAIYGRRAYMALFQRRRPDDAVRIDALARQAGGAGVRAVVTGDVLYHAPEARLLQDVVTAVREKCTVDELGYRREVNADRALKSPDEMARRFRAYPDALQASVDIARACTFSLDELAYQYPHERVVEGLTAQEALEQMANDAVDRLQAAIAANKRDFEARYELAQTHFAAQRFTEAMDELLEILMRDKAWSEDAARKTYIAILDIMEPPKPKVADGQIPPDDPVVATYRRRLSSVVLS
jgi:DNA polymerase III alpha subunit